MREQDRHLWEPFLHKITNWCVCVSETYERLKLLPTNPNPEAPGDRAAAHMSLHLQPTMSKSRRASSPGSSCSGHRLHRLRRGAKRTRDLLSRPRPLAGAPYMCGPPTRQPAFCKNVAAAVRAARAIVSTARAST
jgi:CHAD domain-containing protein